MTDQACQFVVGHTTETQCRSCAASPLADVLDLGVTPLADRLLRHEDLDAPEPVCPLSVAFCEACGLLQLRQTVPPQVLFDANYPYYSSVSASLLEHFRRSVDEARLRKSVDAHGLVMDIASNDGYLLRNYIADGIPVLGVDPAEGPVAAANAIGVETLQRFFTRELADELAADGIEADIVHANNVLAHVADTNGFVDGLRRILRADGLLVIEFPYVVDLIDHGEFDTIYHQHLCYFSLKSVSALLGRHGLFVNDVQRTAVHGGSLRVFAAKTARPDASVHSLLEFERQRGVGNVAFYHSFASRVDRTRRQLIALLDRLKSEGATLVGYGAPAKGCTLLSYMGIGDNYLDYLVDKNPHKQQRYFSGNHLPIRSPDMLLAERPDYALLLPWNFADEILAEQAQFRAAGGRFVVPIPEPVIR